MVEWIGWGSSIILLMTLVRQVYTQWRTRATAGVSKWLFIGQLAASAGYILYSYLLHNWVYVSSNIAIPATALAWNPIAPNGINILRSRRAVERRVSRTVDTTAGHGAVDSITR